MQQAGTTNPVRRLPTLIFGGRKPSGARPESTAELRQKNDY
jgi:hypothetical protein